jgi:hypothetical protein
MSRMRDLFDDSPCAKPARRSRRTLMHVSDVGEVSCGAAEDLGKPMCRMQCRRCGTTTGWLVFETVTEARRGIACEKCNAAPVTPEFEGGRDEWGA